MCFIYLILVDSYVQETFMNHTYIKVPSISFGIFSSPSPPLKHLVSPIFHSTNQNCCILLYCIFFSLKPTAPTFFREIFMHIGYSEMQELALILALYSPVMPSGVPKPGELFCLQMCVGLLLPPQQSVSRGGLSDLYLGSFLQAFPLILVL